MKTIILAMIINMAMLTGCATDQALVNSAPSTEVDKIVAVGCVKPEEIPVMPKTAMPDKGDVGQNAAGAKADLYAYKAELKRAIVLLKACVIAEADHGSPAK